MNCSMINDFLNQSFSSFFKCKQNGKYLSIQTPFYYPDGDVIEIFVHQRSGKIVVSDLGETMRYLGAYDLDVKNYSKRQVIINDVINLLNVKFIKNVFYKPIKSMDHLPEDLFDLSQCIIRICDLLYTVRGSSPAGFVEEVKDFLDFHKFKFEEGFTVETTSDHKYEFDLGIEVDDSTIKLVKLMSPPSKSTQKPNFDRVLRMWVDLENFSEYKKSSRITLLDDTNYIWRDLILIEKYSIVTDWSDKEGFLNALKTKVA